ncbi:hypothetical protein MRX96_003590 [Rhipicephalus microplus]
MHATFRVPPRLAWCLLVGLPSVGPATLLVETLLKQGIFVHSLWESKTTDTCGKDLLDAIRTESSNYDYEWNWELDTRGLDCCVITLQLRLSCCQCIETYSEDWQPWQVFSATLHSRATHSLALSIAVAMRIAPPPHPL